MHYIVWHQRNLSFLSSWVLCSLEIFGKCQLNLIPCPAQWGPVADGGVDGSQYFAAALDSMAGHLWVNTG